MDLPFKAFLSHREEDGQVVQALAARLESAGLHVASSGRDDPIPAPPAVIVECVGEGGRPAAEPVRRVERVVVAALLPGAADPPSDLAASPLVDFRDGIVDAAVARLAVIIRARTDSRSLSSTVQSAAWGFSRPVSASALAAKILEGDLEAQHRTALWTILNLRWPRLGDHLADHPEHVAAIGNGEVPAGVPSSLAPLFSDTRVVAVVEGQVEDVDVRLDEQAIRICVGRT